MTDIVIAPATAPGWFDADALDATSPAAPAAVLGVPPALNEAPYAYAAGTAERARLDAALGALRDHVDDLPLVIGGRARSGSGTEPAVIPHRHGQTLATVRQAGPDDVAAAIVAARAAWQDWHRWPWHERAAVMLRAAALVAGPYRERLTAATMLDQSKTVAEAEADAACELVDFLRFNVANLRRMLGEQPESTVEAWNRLEYRPLEGFVYAVSPFNFTAIGGNLPTTPALLGNTVLWKPSAHAALGANIIMEVLAEAGLPDGVINLVHGDPAAVTEVVLASRDLAGVHFTGSTVVFRGLWARIAADLGRYRSIPRIVGETGGKDFIVAHPSADFDAVATGIVRASFEYQGQKCSASSRLYLPASRWPELRDRLVAEIQQLRVGDVEAPETDVGAVISATAFRRLEGAIEEARRAPDTRIVAGGGVDDGEGWFVEPTLIETTDPGSRLLRDELFGPVVTAHVYEDRDWSQMLALVDRTGDYALTGSVFATERAALREAEARLEYAAGNLYVNDKPTGAIVGQQPFGGSRASGTNDKTGTAWHLTRWVTPRAVKETLLAPRHMPRSAPAEGVPG